MLGGLMVSACSMPLLIRVARRLGIVDHPTHRKIHSNPTPYLGGLGIVLGFTLIPALYYSFFPEHSHPGTVLRFAMIVGPALAGCVLGVADDKRPIRAKFKLFAQIAIALSFAYFGFRIELIEFPGTHGGYGLFDWESIPITVLWMLVVINGVNLVDGIDGLAGSVSAMIFLAIALLALSLEEPDFLVAAIALAAFGATVGFLFFNWRPAKIYMGDAGSMASGTLIATLLIALGQRKMGGTVTPGGESVISPYSYQFAKITLVAFYPIMEISLSVVRRLLSGKPIGSADKGHVHHRLLRWGWNAHMVCGAAVLICAIFGATVIFAQLGYRGVASSLLLTGGVAFVLLMHYCGFLELFHPKAIRGNRPHFLIANHFISMQCIKLELAQNVGEIAALTEQTCIEFGVEKYSISLASDGPPAKPFELDWNKPETARGSILLAAGPLQSTGTRVSFSDKVLLPSGTQSTWTFEPHSEEEEIDVEYRVLMSDFMRKALGCAEKLYRQRSAVLGAHDGPNENSTSVRSSELRRRKTNSDKFDGIQQVKAAVPPPNPSAAHEE